MMLAKHKLKLHSIFRSLRSADTLHFSLFLGMVCFLYKSTLCTTRRFNRTHDKYNALIAGLVCSLAAFADNSAGRRQTITLYVFARTLESFMKLLDNNKIAEEPKDWGFYVMALGAILFTYTLYCEYDVALPSVRKTFAKFACLKPNEKAMLKIYERAPL